MKLYKNIDVFWCFNPKKWLWGRQPFGGVFFGLIAFNFETTNK